MVFMEENKSSPASPSWAVRHAPALAAALFLLFLILGLFSPGVPLIGGN